MNQIKPTAGTAQPGKNRRGVGPMIPTALTMANYVHQPLPEADPTA
jgi:hypothetical protein